MKREGFVYLVGAGPGDPRLLTMRAYELLRSAEVVAHDELVTPAILALAPRDAEMLPVGRRHGSGTVTHRLHPAVLERARAGRSVVRLKCGDPLIFGRGGEEAEELAEAGIPYEIVPGISAALGAAAYAGIPLTHRVHSSAVTFATGHDADGIDRPRGETIVLYMSVRKLTHSLERLIGRGLAPTTPAAYVASATTPDQRVIVGTLADLPEKVAGADPSVPALVIVGEVVALRERIAWFERGTPGRPATARRARPQCPASDRRSMIPRVVIAGTSSGVGKTTVTVGLAGALRTRGLRVAVFKCGPDYLDPTYHARAADAPCHNLDGWMMGREAVVTTFARASRGADVALIEGVMGLFDGASPTGDEGSTAEIAKWLQAPVLLVCDASGMARSVHALARGFATFDAGLHVAGLVCNRVGSRGHLDLLREATGSSLPTLGGLPDERALVFPERHLGLLTADRAAVPDSVFSAWGERVAEWLDVDAILAVARTAAPLPEVPAEDRIDRQGPRCRIGLAFDEAFHFYYDDNLRRLEGLGAELVRFSPVHDARLPDVDGLYVGGGYPEVHAEALSRNTGMLEDVAAFAANGGPIYGECGGLMYLSNGIRTLDGRLHPMAGIVPGEAQMRDRLQALGYVEVDTLATTSLGSPGLRFRGHQFRYSDLQLETDIEHVYTVRRRRGGAVFKEGYRVGNTLASYVHAHWASNPLIAKGLVDACVAHARRTR